MSSNKSIAKNSLFLYSRMFLNMLVGIFTAGIVLNTLGITDYGIYNIVGGFVALFGFLNASMSSATQRFLSFDLGKGDLDQLQKTFSTTVSIHWAIAILIFLVLETFGLWYVNHKLNVPQERMKVINIVYQFSVFSAFLNILQVPYNALITAHERFNVYAYISFLELGFKILILFLLVHLSGDKLALYALMLFVSSFIIRMIYRIYCRRNFPESKYRFYFNKAYFQTLISYTGWNLFGNIAYVAKTQGNNLVLNIFFGTTLNAAYGISAMFQGIVSSFVSNFQTAVNPQIIKTYATGDLERSIQLIQQSSKFSFGLMLVMAVPIFLSTQFILDLWLKNYPHESILFIQLCLINILIDTISNPIMFGLQATGKIKAYQAIVGILLFLNLPISYVLIRITHQPEIIFLVSIVLSVLALIGRLYFLKKQMRVSLRSYGREVILRIVGLSLMMGLFCFIIKEIEMPFNSILNFILVSGVAVLINLLLSYWILFNQEEKRLMGGFLKNKLNFKK